MDIRQLRYFVAVGLHENFSRAAQQLFIAQPALSRQILALEEELGVKLFDRHLRGATLTPQGRQMLDRARYLLRSFDEIANDMRETRGPPSGPIVVGMTPNFTAVFGATLVGEVKKRYPGAQLSIVQAYSPALRDMLRDKSVDIALLAGQAPTPTNSIAVEPLFEDRICLVGRAGDRLLSRSEIGVRQLRGVPLILTGLSSAGIRNELEALANRYRVPLEVAVEVDTFGLAADLIRAGMGYTAYIRAGLARHPDLVAVPIAGLWFPRSLAWPIDRPLSRLAGEVLALIRQSIHDMVEAGTWKDVRKPGRSKLQRA